ncbi:MAG: hypothetical protein L6R40_004634 [Gallowayella cf. fulva]|nr:MAG: hypothetical protein L6R40_004634 [Xanthomendoza cf. fulva]
MDEESAAYSAWTEPKPAPDTSAIVSWQTKKPKKTKLPPRKKQRVAILEEQEFDDSYEARIDEESVQQQPQGNDLNRPCSTLVQAASNGSSTAPASSLKSRTDPATFPQLPKPVWTFASSAYFQSFLEKMADQDSQAAPAVNCRGRGEYLSPGHNDALFEEFFNHYPDNKTTRQHHHSSTASSTEHPAEHRSLSSIVRHLQSADFRIPLLPPALQAKYMLLAGITSAMLAILA